MTLRLCTHVCTSQAYHRVWKYYLAWTVLPFGLEVVHVLEAERLVNTPPGFANELDDYRGKKWFICHKNLARMGQSSYITPYVAQTNLEDLRWRPGNSSAVADDSVSTKVGGVDDRCG